MRDGTKVGYQRIGPRVRGVVMAVLSAAASSACAEMRQNMRNEFASYRGAWFCAKDGCALGQMQRSTAAHREGDITVNHGDVGAGAALAFSVGKSPKTFTATVSDCKGKTVDVPAEDILQPGNHGLAGQSDAWVVRVNPAKLPDLQWGKGCKKWMVTTQATWDKGSTWEQKGGIADK